MTLVFARKMSPGLTSLVKKIDESVTASDGKSNAFIVFAPEDGAALKKQLEDFAADEKVELPLTIANDNGDLKEKFNVTPSDEMPVNVLVYREKKVAKAFTFAEAEIEKDDLEAVQTAMTENAK
ncbi:MAG TPA: hypothetical protein VNA16_05175 [Abditibacteriaceae bacterium]|nr:hypothetical protein [Abditibacteriaceae bacterium]